MPDLDRLVGPPIYFASAEVPNSAHFSGSISKTGIAFSPLEMRLGPAIKNSGAIGL